MLWSFCLKIAQTSCYSDEDLDLKSLLWYFDLTIRVLSLETSQFLLAVLIESFSCLMFFMLLLKLCHFVFWKNYAFKMCCRWMLCYVMYLLYQLYSGFVFWCKPFKILLQIIPTIMVSNHDHLCFLVCLTAAHWIKVSA